MDLKIVVERLVANTQDGLVEWREIGDGRGCLDTYEGYSNGVKFELCLEGARLFINGVFIGRQTPELSFLRTTIFNQISASREAKEDSRQTQVLKSAAKALGL